MANLLRETIEILEEHGKTIKDIVAVQGNDFGISVENFIRLANTIYDDGYGAPKVAVDLFVIGDDFWLERQEYDGSEWWEYKERPAILENILEVTALTINQCKIDYFVGWETLKRLNFESEEK